MKALISFLLFFYSANVCAQNLVPNGSFEDAYSCPSGLDRVDSCISWKGMGWQGNPLPGTPDYFASCALYPNSIPQNALGDQLPFMGDAYMGLYTYIWAYFYREIIGAKMLDTMIAGYTYRISMRISRGNWTNQNYNCSASNKMGIRFTTHEHSKDYPPHINNYASVWVDSILTDTLNWICLDWAYTADSNYTHLYIGNFFDDAHTDTLVINAPLGQFGQAYYFIDSVNIFCIDEACATGVSSQLNPTLTISPNPASTQINIVYSITQTSTLTITDAYGRVVKQLTLYPYFKNRIVYTDDLVPGVYLVNLFNGKESFSQKVVVMK